jgi:Mlc titration factor MtfA (ptsG expression regulator)
MINPLYLFYKLSKSEKDILANHVTFYKNLSKQKKRKFEFRVARFISKHNFVAREDVMVTPLKKVIVSSIAIMITFKMQNYLYRPFENIILYPKDYLSFHTKKMHKGETNPRAKTIVFSWEGLVEGIKIEDDNLNLGIHEFTHALFFSCLKSLGNESIEFVRNHKKILKFLEDKKEQKRLIDANYFRAYAYENQFEFLAVITENYFETPEIFKQKLPELFFLVNNLYKIY